MIDDEAQAGTVLAGLLRGRGFDAEIVRDTAAALDRCKSFSPHVVVMDVNPRDLDGLARVNELRHGDAPPAVVVTTAPRDVTSAIDALRAGAADYLIKPIDVDELAVVLEKVLATQALVREASQLRQRVRDRVAPRNIIGAAPAMQRVLKMIDQVAPSKATVLLTGESGTGKELMANAIHQRSPRSNGPFIKLHCAGLATSVLESELFGHERDVFAGAVPRKDGQLALAHGGTMFLDEIAEVSPAVQVKLLRFLQDHALERVGSTQTIRPDVRVIAATHRDLPEAIAGGRFRADLYYRLNVVAVEMPALRDRQVDILELVKLFIDRYARAQGKAVEGCTMAARELLQRYGWPGNVRELEVAIERAVALANGAVIDVDDLPAHLPCPTIPSGMPVVPGASMAAIERYAILETLKETGSTSRAAALLGLSPRTIQYRLREYRTTPDSKATMTW